MDGWNPSTSTAEILPFFINEKWLDEGAIYHPKWDEINCK